MRMLWIPCIVQERERRDVVSPAPLTFRPPREYGTHRMFLSIVSVSVAISCEKGRPRVRVGSELRPPGRPSRVSTYGQGPGAVRCGRRTEPLFPRIPLTSRRREGSLANDHDLTDLTVRIPKELRFRLWQMKIIKGVKIETFIQDAIEEKFRTMDP